MAWVRRWLAVSSRGWVLVGLTIVNILVIWLFGVRSRLYAPPDAIALQLAFWPSVFAGVVDQWGPEKAHDFLVTLLGLDFLFPLLYASLLRGLYVWLCLKLKMGSWRGLQWAPWVAAGFDIVENLLQIRLVGRALAGGSLGSGFAAGVFAVSFCAAAKWTLVLASVLGTVAVLRRSDVGWAIGTCRFGLLSVLLGSLPLSSTSQGLDVLRTIADAALSKPQAVGTYLALVLWATSVWYWSRVLLQIRWTAEEPEGGGERLAEGRQTLAWLPRTLGTATLLLAALAFLKASKGMPEPLRGQLLLHAGYCLAIAVAFFYFVKWRRWLFRLPSEPVRHNSWVELPLVTRALAAASLAMSIVVLCLFVFAPVPVGWWLGAPAILFLAAANAVFFGSGSVLVGRSLRIPLVTFALVAGVVFSTWNDNHAVRLVGTGVPAPRPDLHAAFQAWAAPRLDEWRKEQKPGPMPVFLVAAEGGGIRAAYWTAIVLGRLQDHRPDFARHVFGISGVSGGSLGAAVFVALLHDRVPEFQCRDYAWRQEHQVGPGTIGATQTCAQEILRQDLLAPALGKLLAPDFLQWFVPVPVPAFDRATAIEGSWSAAYERVTGRNTLDQPFLAISRCEGRDCEGDGALAGPALLLNGTHVHTGQRLLRAPVSWPNTFSEDPTGDVMPQVTDLTDLLESDVRLSTAAHDSARFAYVSPAGRLLSAKGRDFGHVVDGGYFENSGAATLKDVLHVLERTPLKEPVRFMILYLCNNPGRCFGATVGADPAEAQEREPGLGEVFSPVRALLGARDARGALAIAHARQDLVARFLEFGFLEFGACPVAEEPPVPLGWQLSDVMRARLNAQAAGAGSPGNKATEACVREALEGAAGRSTCKPAFKPADGCGPEPPPTVEELVKEQ